MFVSFLFLLLLLQNLRQDKTSLYIYYIIYHYWILFYFTIIYTFINIYIYIKEHYILLERALSSLLAHFILELFFLSTHPHTHMFPQLSSLVKLCVCFEWLFIILYCYYYSLFYQHVYVTFCKFCMCPHHTHTHSLSLSLYIEIKMVQKK